MERKMDCFGEDGMHGLKRLQKLKRIMDGRAAWFGGVVPALNNVFSVDPIFGLLHWLIALTPSPSSSGRGE